MKSNIGKIDKVIRIILGLAIIFIAVSFGSVLGIIGILLLVSAYWSFCPLYKILGICTNKNDNNSSACKNGCGCTK